MTASGGDGMPCNIPGYEVISRLGSGGMSHVWKARETGTGRLVALKILNKTYSASQDDLRRFKDEERILEAIDHPGIVKGYKFGFVAGSYTWYYAMEYVDGYDFGALLQRKQHLREQDCLLICESVALALDYAWRELSLVHCDIKPDNILINTAGEIKLADLGLGQLVREINDRETAPRDFVLGTPDYISPEQIYSDEKLDCRADIYSLAATLYRLSTGRCLFPARDSDEKLRDHCDPDCQGKDPRTYRPGLSDGFCRMLEAMLVKDRDGRIGRWSDVYETCLAVENGVEIEPREGPVSSMRLGALAPERVAL